MSAPLSVVIPVLNSAEHVGPAVARVLPHAGEIIVVDGGSTDGTCEIAQKSGAKLVLAPKGRGRQLAAGGEAAAGDWLLFLHVDTKLSEGWADEAGAFIADRANRERAAYCRLAFDDPGRRAKFVASVANWRARWLGLPYGDQGLLVSRTLYDAVGGFDAAPLMEDVAIAQRIGRRRLTALQSLATTSAVRYRHDGWARRVARNGFCLSLFMIGVSPERIARLYG